MKTEPRTTAEMVIPAMERLLERFAATTGGDESQNDQQSDSVAFCAPSPNLVRTSNGWGPKYVEPITPAGARWLAEFETAKQVVRDCGILVLLGNRGTGKTRMAAEIARLGDWPVDSGEWNGHRIEFGKTALYRRAMDVFLELRDAGKVGSKVSEKDVLAKLENPGLLVIDEFQERGGSEWENRTMTNLLDKRYSAERPTIIIANIKREELKQNLSPSVLDRIRENGRGIVFDWESYRKG